MNFLQWLKSQFDIKSIRETQSILDNGTVPHYITTEENEPTKVHLPSQVDELIEVGQAYGYDRYVYQPKNKMLSLFKDDVRINIYHTTMTVATCLKHPTQGKTQLFRKNVTGNELEKILQNPRVHTGKGYAGINKNKLK